MGQSSPLAALQEMLGSLWPVAVCVLKVLARALIVRGRRKERILGEIMGLNLAQYDQ